MRKLFKERKLFKGGNYMRKYGYLNFKVENILKGSLDSIDPFTFSENSIHGR